MRGNNETREDQRDLDFYLFSFWCVSERAANGRGKKRLGEEALSPAVALAPRVEKLHRVVCPMFARLFVYLFWRVLTPSNTCDWPWPFMALCAFGCLRAPWEMSCGGKQNSTMNLRKRLW